MPLQRTPLRDTDGNQRFRGPELSPYQRGEIVGLRKGSKSPREIEVELSLSRRAVRYTLESIQVCDKGKTLPRSGMLVKYDSQACQHMLYNLRNHPKMTYKQRRTATGLGMSDSYIYHLASAENL